MIITLIGADFSKSNIGTLSSWIISRVLGDGATYAGPSYVDKDAALSATVTLDEGYEIGAAGITVIMGGTVLDESYYSVVDNVITFTIASVTGSVVIKVPTLNTNTGEEDVIPNYVFTINPTPTNATVTLSATGYSTVSGTGNQSITVANGTEVNWSVSADGYTEQNGNWTINGSNKTEDIVLSATGGEGGDENTNEYNSTDMWLSQTISAVGAVSTTGITQSNIMAKSRFVGSATFESLGEAFQMALVTYNDDGSFKARGSWTSLTQGSPVTFEDENPFNVVIATKTTNTSYTVEQMVAMLNIVGTSEDSLWDGTIYSDFTSCWIRQSMDGNGNVVAEDNAIYNRSNLMAASNFNESIKITAKSVKLMTAIITYDTSGKFISRSTWSTVEIGQSVTYTDANPFNVIIASHEESNYSLEEMLALIDVRSAE